MEKTKVNFDKLFINFYSIKELMEDKETFCDWFLNFFSEEFKYKILNEYPLEKLKKIKDVKTTIEFLEEEAG